MEILDGDLREDIARSVISDLRQSAPHCILGLSDTEIDQRIETSLSKIGEYEIRSIGDIEAFVRLVFQVGPNFDEYPVFRQIFHDPATPVEFLMTSLFKEAAEQDWVRAAVFDIVSRSKDSINPTSGNTAPASDRGVAGVSLVPLESAYAGSYFQLSLHSDVWRLADLHPMVELAEVDHHIEDLKTSRNTDSFAILDSNNDFVGAASVKHRDGLAEITYWIGRPFWGKGIATIAVSELLKILRFRAGVSRIGARMYRGNLPSLRVAEKCGFTRSGDSDTETVKLLYF